MNQHQENYLIYGRMPVMELLTSGKPIEKILVSNGQIRGNIIKIIDIVKNLNIPIKKVAKSKLDQISNNNNHQGIIAFVAASGYSEMDDIFKAAKEKNQPPFIIILDEIEDPYNMGAIIRTAEASGVHGIIIPKRRNAGLSPTVMKSSAGACNHIHIVRVSNLVNTINFLKDHGLWIYSLDSSGQTWYNVKYDGPLAVIVGSEGKGIGKLIRESSDFIISLPMLGKVNSLNVSVASGILMYEIVKQKTINFSPLFNVTGNKIKN